MASLPTTVRQDASVNPPSEFYFTQPTNPYRDWLSSLRHRWLLTSTTGAVIMLCIIAALFFVTPRYRATAMVMIQPRITEVVKVNPVLSQLPSDSDTVTSELQVVRSHDLLLRLVTELHLDAHPEFDPNVPSAWKQPAREALETVRPWLPSPVAGWLTEQLAHKPLEGKSRLNAVVESVGRHIEAKPMGTRSRVLGITFFARDRKLPDLVVNALADLYIKNQFEMKQRTSEEANRWITGDLARLSQNSAAAARHVADFRAANGFIEGRDTALIRQQISELDTHLTDGRVQRIALAAKLKNVSAPNSNSLVLASPLIQQLRQQQSNLATQNTELRFNFGDKHPHLLANNAQMADIERRITDEVEKILSGLRSDYQTALDHENALLRQLDGLKQEMARLQVAEVTLKQLEEDERTDRALYENFLQRSKETLRSNFEIPEAILISHAAEPLAPYFPDKGLFLAVGGLLSLLIGLLAAIGGDKLDRSFRSQRQVENALGVPVLGIVPEFSRKTHEGALNPLSLIGSAMTDICTQLKLDTSRCILIASALPREGKTTVGLLLARTAAMNGQRVLLVDGDMRRSGLHGSLHTGEGLSDVLTGRTELAQAIVRAPQSGIDCITCGSPADNPCRLLASVAMREFLSDARQRYDLVIVDSPAVMVAPDAVILGRLADETLLFARWARTPREVVHLALRRLNEGGGRVAGAILSRTDLKRIHRYSITDGLSYSRAMRRYYPIRQRATTWGVAPGLAPRAARRSFESFGGFWKIK
jgi:succinoglycan biosynthesis transport protein ExoP